MKLATDTARLDVEYEQGKSQLDEERDLIQYYQFHAERGYAKDAQVAMGNDLWCDNLLFFPWWLK